jgi:hypothetical protein
MREGGSHCHLEQVSPSCAVPPRSDTAVGAHFGSAGQGPENGPSEGEVIGQTEGGG